VQKTPRAEKEKKRLDSELNRVYMHRGLPCSKEKLVSTALDVCYPQSSSRMTSFSCGKHPTMTGPTCDDMYVLINNDSIQNFN
jgi:hypothetical protein